MSTPFVKAIIVRLSEVCLNLFRWFPSYKFNVSQYTTFTFFTVLQAKLSLSAPILWQCVSFNGKLMGPFRPPGRLLSTTPCYLYLPAPLPAVWACGAGRERAQVGSAICISLFLFFPKVAFLLPSLLAPHLYIQAFRSGSHPTNFHSLLPPSTHSCAHSHTHMQTHKLVVDTPLTTN